MEIEPLLTRIRAGDRHAFAEVVAHFQGPLFGFLGRMGLTQAHGEDVAQEAFLRAWRQLSDYQPSRGAFSTWLFTIARNLALNELSGAHAQRTTASDEVPEPMAEDPQPADALIAEQRRRRLQAALRKLPVTDRSAVALAYIKELALDDVARIEGCTVGALKVRLHRAKQKLRELLEQDDG